jgi:hypothetical protein
VDVRLQGLPPQFRDALDEDISVGSADGNQRSDAGSFIVGLSAFAFIETQFSLALLFCFTGSK